MSLTGAQSLPIAEAIDAADIVVIAVPFDFYASLPHEKLSGKVIIDVSNRNSMHKKIIMWVVDTTDKCIQRY